MQEFLAAVYRCENKDQFERIIVPRYQARRDQADKCINELSQTFIFLCGLDVKLADKMSDLMNNQLGINSTETGEFIGNDENVYRLTRLVVHGVEEADNNDFPDVCLCMRYICVDNSQIMCNRLIKMNQLQLISLTLKPNALANNDYLKGVALQHCPQLQELMLYGAHLGDHELLLPVSITRIALFNVTLTAPLVLQHYTQLQKLRLTTVNLVDQELRLPDYITSVDLYNVNLTAGIVLQHCIQIQELKLGEANLGNQKLLLPAIITNINLYEVILTTGLSMQHCTLLQKLTLRKVNLGDQGLMVPDSITSIDLVGVTVAARLSMQTVHNYKFV